MTSHSFELFFRHRVEADLAEDRKFVEKLAWRIAGHIFGHETSNEPRADWVSQVTEDSWQIGWCTDHMLHRRGKGLYEVSSEMDGEKMKLIEQILCIDYALSLTPSPARSHFRNENSAQTAQL